MPTQTESFRDPAGSVRIADGRVLRNVSNEAAGNLLELLNLGPIQAAVQQGTIVSTEWLSREADGPQAVVQHEFIRRSYPYEWPPEMLYRAGELTLDLCEMLLPMGYGLKDATPYNVLYRGPKPVFVDVLSFERRNPQDPIWLPFAQFIRTFLLPLLALKAVGLETHELLYSRRDGLLPQDVWQWLSAWKRLRPPALQLVAIPRLLSSLPARQPDIYKSRSTGDPDQVRYLLGRLFRKLRSHLQALAPPVRKSSWSRYMGDGSSYTPSQFEAKQYAMQQFIDEASPKAVLDLGCNTGHFSIMAAERVRARVVAIDSDAPSVGLLWRSANRLDLQILPLVIDIARPTPSVGWLNCECPSFLARAREKFDMVFGLALIHHLLVVERIPLPSIISLIAELTTDWAVIEYVGKEDPMFAALARGRDHLHESFCQRAFENECARAFTIVRTAQIPDCSRVLYLLRKRR